MSKYGRKLLAAREIDAYAYAAYDRMIWSLSRPGSDSFTITYKSIAALTGCCRDRAIKSVKQIVAAGLTLVTKRRRFIYYGRVGAFVRRSVQAANQYTLRLPIESSRPATSSGLRILPCFCPPVVTEKSALQAMLERLGANIRSRGSSG